MSESFEELREAGGKAWDKIDDPEAYLGRGPEISQATAMELLEACEDEVEPFSCHDESIRERLLVAIAKARAELGLEEDTT